MRRFLVGFLLSLALLTSSPRTCFAQVFSPNQYVGGGGFGGSAGFGGGGIGSPAQNVTPYLGLSIGRNAASNYFTAVSPFTQQSGLGSRPGIQDLSPQRTTSLLDLPDEFVPEIPQTGHNVRFLTYYPYYNIGFNQQRSRLLFPFQPQPKPK